MNQPGIVGLVAGSKSASFQRLNAHLLAPTVKENLKVAPAAKRIRQRTTGDGMNKWEREFGAHLALHWENVHREVSLPLANGLRYKVDFLCADGVFVAGFEVKGFARSTGIAKLKMAARLYPWVRFHLATKRKDLPGGWALEEVFP